MRIRIILPSFVLPLFLLGLLFGVSPMRSGASSQGQDQVTAAQLAAALEAQKQADAKLTRGESAERRFQELSAKIQQTAGTAPVIIRLQVAFRPEGEIQQEAERLAQREAIRQAQDDLLNSVFGGAPASLKRFVYVPYLAVSVDAAQLDALRSAPQVLDIYDDTPAPVAQAQSPSISLIGAPNAWASGYTGEGEFIAILDTGVDKNHPALSGKVVSEACYSTNASDFGVSSLCPGGVTESVEDNSGLNCSGVPECDHGTSVAGVVAGVAGGAQLISIQVNSRVDDAEQCGAAAPCLLANPSDQMKGLERVYTLSLSETYKGKIAAANISIGKGRNTGACDSNPIKTTIDQLRSVGIATVVASGNGEYADALGSPSCVSSAVSVGATGDGASLPAGEVMSISNSASFLSLLAPGYYVSAPVPGGGFDNVSGTSIAAAHVSGAWALLKQQQPTASVSAVLSRLVNNGVNVTDPRNNITKPRIKVDAALSCLQNVPASKWKGEYFDNPDLEGDPVMIRDDGGSFLSMNFGAGIPSSICGPGADNFSVRWTRTVNLDTNVYQFSVAADDGARLYVDSQLKLDFWNGPPGTNTVNVLLNGGDHVIKLEFREFGGTAQASLSWIKPCIADVPADRWKGEYFNNRDLAGSPLMARDDGNGFLNFDWGDGGPSSACMLGVDNFSARWTRTVNFAAARYRFTVANVDDGVGLYIDGQLKINQWVLAAGTHTVDVDLSAGNHVIKLEFFENTGLARANISWALIPICQVSVVVVNPSAYQGSVTDISNTGHGSTSVDAYAEDIQLDPSQNITQTKSARWSSFQGGQSGGIISLKLKFDWTALFGNVDAFVQVAGSASARINFDVDYSTDGGLSWTNALSRSRLVSQSGSGSKTDGISDGGSVEIVLSPSQNISLIQVRDSMRANAVANAPSVLHAYAGSGATISPSVSSIRLEVEMLTPTPCVP